MPVPAKPDESNNITAAEFETLRKEVAGLRSTTKQAPVAPSSRVGRDVLVGVVSAVLSALVLWGVAGLGKTLSDAAAERVATQIAEKKLLREEFARVLSESKYKESFRGPGGPKGPQGERGDPGRRGQPGIGLPIGTVVAWPGEFPGDDAGVWRPGDGSEWRVCDGKTHDVVSLDKSELYKAIGATYGPPVGTSVALPNFQGMFLRGAGGEGVHIAEKLGESQRDTVGKHVHFGVLRNAQDGGKRAIHAELSSSPARATGDNTSRATDPNKSPEGSVGVVETRPVNYAVHWVIRVR